MADYTVDVDDIGVYEIPLTANESTTVTFQTRNLLGYVATQVMVHSATAPVYVRPGAVVDIKDPRAVVVLPGTWVDVPAGYDSPSVSVISADDAVVSVSKA